MEKNYKIAFRLKIKLFLIYLLENDKTEQAAYFDQIKFLLKEKYEKSDL